MSDSAVKENIKDKPVTTVVLRIAANQTVFTYYVYCMRPFLQGVFWEIGSGLTVLRPIEKRWAMI